MDDVFYDDVFYDDGHIDVYKFSDPQETSLMTYCRQENIEAVKEFLKNTNKKDIIKEK